jgi:hypothetical protein
MAPFLQLDESIHEELATVAETVEFAAAKAVLGRERETADTSSIIRHPERIEVLQKRRLRPKTLACVNTFTVNASARKLITQ